jgi:hypothetical protein
VSLPYVYTPRPGEWVRISRIEGTGQCLIGTYEEECGHATSTMIRAEEVPGVAPGIAVAMHEAAGLPAPVILERPESRELLVPGAGGGRSWVTVERRMSADRSAGAGVMLSVAADSSSMASIRLVGDEPLRVALALADAVNGTGGEPDPKRDASELAEAISAEMARRGASFSDVFHVAADVALRWMKQREAKP